MILVVGVVLILAVSALGGIGQISSSIKGVAVDGVRPVRTGFSDFFAVVGRALSGPVHYGSVVEQNQKLREEYARLKSEQLAQADVAESLKELRALLAVGFVQGLQTVPAEVTDVTTHGFTSTIEIGIGRSSGVRVSMAVICSTGLAGQVVSTTASTAIVRLISDGQSAIGVRYGPGPKDLGVTAGQGVGKPIQVSLVPVHEPLLVAGQVLTTSGIQGAIEPGGIPVGRVVSIDNSPTGTDEAVGLQPMSDLTNLRYVAVVLAFGE